MFVFNERIAEEQAVPAWGARGPEFKSRRPDQIITCQSLTELRQFSKESLNRLLGLQVVLVSDERLVPLNRIVGHVSDTFAYAYDFGDDWQHDILLEAKRLSPQYADEPARNTLRCPCRRFGPDAAKCLAFGMTVSRTA